MLWRVKSHNILSRKGISVKEMNKRKWGVYLSKKFEKMRGQFQNYTSNLIRHRYIVYKRMEDFEKKKKKRNFQQLYFHYCSLLFERKGFERRKKKEERASNFFGFSYSIFVSRNKNCFCSIFRKNSPIQFTYRVLVILGL